MMSNHFFRLANAQSARIFPAIPSRPFSQPAHPYPAANFPNARPIRDGKPHRDAKPFDTPALPYSVARNSQGSLPVYSDIRNGGSRYLVLVRNVKGNVNALRDDLTSSLFQPGSPEAARLKVIIPRSDSLVLTGGRWKHRIMDWLRLKGF